MDIVNPAGHTHRPVRIQGQDVCQDCGEVIIKPILSFDDERLKGVAAEGLTAEDIATTLLGTPEEIVELMRKQVDLLGPMRLDLQLIELSERLGREWPDYIDQLAEFTNGENPPHLSDAALGKVE